MNETITYAVDPIEMFPTVEQLIYDVCWQFARTYPISFDECRSEAFAAFMRACMDYKPGRGTKFSTWARFWVWTKLKDLVMKRSGDKVTVVDEIDEGAELCWKEERPDESPCMELLKDLGEDVRVIADLFLDLPADLLPGAVARVRKLLKREKWEEQRFQTALDLLRTRLQQATV